LSDVAETVDDGVRARSLGAGAREGGRDPGESDVVRAEESAEHEEQGEIARTGHGGSSRDDKAIRCGAEEGWKDGIRDKRRSAQVRRSLEAGSDSPNHSDGKRNGQVEATLGLPVTHATDDDGEDCGDEVGRGGEEESDFL
jgi:hypothetical protein